MADISIQTRIPRVFPGPVLFRQVTLKVTPDVLIAKAEELRNAASRMNGEIQGMTQVINRTQGYWNGEAADLYRNRYRQLLPEAEEMLGALRKHAENLTAIAREYIATEVGLTQQGGALPSNID